MKATVLAAAMLAISATHAAAMSDERYYDMLRNKIVWEEYNARCIHFRALAGDLIAMYGPHDSRAVNTAMTMRTWCREAQKASDRLLGSFTGGVR